MKVLKTENWALQKLLRGPWNSIPSNALKYLKDIGIPVQARGIADMCLSSQVRCANLTSTCFFGMLYDHSLLLDDSEDVVLTAVGRQHLQSSFFSLWDSSTKFYTDMLDCEARPWVPSLFEQKNIHTFFVLTW